MKGLFCKRNLIAGTLAAAVLVSCVCMGMQNKNTFAVTVSVKNAGLSALVVEHSPTLSPAADFQYAIVNSRIIIKKYIGASATPVIPDNINGLPVTTIAGSAFFRNKTVQSVYIPQSVTTIAAKAFGECDSLTQIKVSPDNTVFASVNGILYSKDLTVLKTFPGGLSGSFTVPKTVVKIGDSAFYYCYQLTQVQMYNTVTTIGQEAFAYCWNLKKIRLSDNLKTLDAYSISYCENLTSIYLPASLTSVGADALLGFLDSGSKRMYNLVDGIYCVNGSYAYGYIQSLGLKPIATPDMRFAPEGVSIFAASFAQGAGLYADVLTGGNLFDSAAALLKNKGFGQYTIYSISAKKDGKNYTLPAGTTIRFDIDASYKYPYALKLCVIKDGKLTTLDSSLSSANGQYYLTASVSTLGTFAVAEYNTFDKGDIDGNGTVNIYDARLALRAAANIIMLGDAQKTAADINNNGIIEISDARRILRSAAKI